MDWKKTLGISAAALFTLALVLGLTMSGWTRVAAQTGPPAAGGQPVGGENPDAPGGMTGAPVVVADGKIRELTANGFTLDAGQRLVNVTVSADTWVVVGGRPAVEGTTESLKVNMGVHVEGTSPADGQIAARVVREMGVNGPPPARPDAGPGQEGRQPPNPNAAQLQGTISAVDSAGVTVALEGGRTVQFQADPATVVYKNGFVALTALQKGDAVEVVRRPMAPMRTGNDARIASTDADNVALGAAAAPDGIPTASLIWVPQNNEKYVQGRVEKVDGNTLLVSTRGGLLMVQLSATTTYRRVTTPGQATESASQADVVVDAPTMIFGNAVLDQERTLAANAVMIMPVPPASPTRPAPLPDNKQP